MENAAVNKPVNDSAFQQQTEEIFPTFEVSASSVKTLKQMKFNSFFPADVTLRIIGVNEHEVGPGRKETYYKLELRELGIKHTDDIDMSPDELKDKIEQTVEETMD